MDIVALVILIVVAIVVAKGVRVVPQQNAWVVERLGKFHSVLVPGLNLVIPFIDTVAYKHSLKEIPLDVPSQVCITRDNTQLAVDGILYFQVTDPKMASYGSSDYIDAISQLAQTTLRSLIGRMEMDRTFEERDEINRGVVLALNEASTNWGVKVLRYEIKDLTPPKEILHAMQRQITAEREKRALIASSRRPHAGADQHRHRRAQCGDPGIRRRDAGSDQRCQGRGRGDQGHRRGKRRSHRPRRACHRTAGRGRGGEPESSGKIRRGIRRHRQNRQHPDRAVEHGGHQQPHRRRDGCGQVAERHRANPFLRRLQASLRACRPNGGAALKRSAQNGYNRAIQVQAGLREQPA
jgi:hypothetical protein